MSPRFVPAQVVERAHGMPLGLVVKSLPSIGELGVAESGSGNGWEGMAGEGGLTLFGQGRISAFWTFHRDEAVLVVGPRAETAAKRHIREFGKLSLRGRDGAGREVRTPLLPDEPHFLRALGRRHWSLACGRGGLLPFRTLFPSRMGYFRDGDKGTTWRLPRTEDERREQLSRTRGVRAWAYDDGMVFCARGDREAQALAFARDSVLEGRARVAPLGWMWEERPVFQLLGGEREEGPRPR